MKTQTSGDDAVNDLRYEIKFEDCLKEKINFCIKQNIAFPSRRHIFFKISNNLITSAFFFAEADTKKHWYALAKASNAALVKLTDWIIKMIMWLIVSCFSVSDLNIAKQTVLFDSPQHGF